MQPAMFRFMNYQKWEETVRCAVTTKAVCVITCWWMPRLNFDYISGIFLESLDGLVSDRFSILIAKLPWTSFICLMDPDFASKWIQNTIPISALILDLALAVYRDSTLTLAKHFKLCCSSSITGTYLPKYINEVPDCHMCIFQSFHFSSVQLPEEGGI